jgi:predicted ATP-dependent endonuclease of OLD family
MLERIQLINFRCFENYTLDFSDFNLLCGKNNAGKTSVVDAIKCLSFVVNRFNNLQYKEPPEWTNVPKRYKGVSPSTKYTNINFKTIVYDYLESPAIVKARLKNNIFIDVYINNKGYIFGIIRKDDSYIYNKTDAKKLKIGELAILPQVAPLLIEENLFQKNYVLESIDTRLSYRHFRNQLYYLKEFYSLFVNNLQSSWPKIKVDQFRKAKNSEDYYSLILRIGPFVAEIADYGHGLQIWAQIIWYLTRSREAQTLVLDEPDVYLHSEMHHKLVDILNSYVNSQIILTSHSIEMINKVEPDNILVIDHDRQEATRLKTTKESQFLIELIGSSINLMYSRLLSSKKLLFVEGKDWDIINRLSRVLECDTSTVPHIQVGGWGGWKYVLSSDLILQNASNEKIEIIALFDSDYHSKKEIDNRIKESLDKNIYLHIWSKKEIENYLLMPDLISRLISKKASKKVDGSVIKSKLHEIYDEYHEYVIEQYTNKIHEENNGIMPGAANKKAKLVVKSLEMQNIVPGKKVISKLSEWVQVSYGVSVSSLALASTISKEEINDEIKDVIYRLFSV